MANVMAYISNSYTIRVVVFGTALVGAVLSGGCASTCGPLRETYREQLLMLDGMDKIQEWEKLYEAAEVRRDAKASTLNKKITLDQTGKPVNLEELAKTKSAQELNAARITLEASREGCVRGWGKGWRGYLPF